MKKVYEFSEEVANANNNKLRGWTVVLAGVLWLTIIFLIIFCYINFGDKINIYAILSVIAIYGSLSVFAYYLYVYDLILLSKMQRFVVTEDNKIYKVCLNFLGGFVLYAGATATGMIADKLLNNNSRIGTVTGKTVGTVMMYRSFFKKIEYMSHCDNVINILEHIEKSDGAYVIEFLKVHSIIEKKRHYVIKCDFKRTDSKGNMIIYNRKIKLQKIYHQYDEIVNLLKNLQNN